MVRGQHFACPSAEKESSFLTTGSSKLVGTALTTRLFALALWPKTLETSLWKIVTHCPQTITHIHFPFIATTFQATMAKETTPKETSEKNSAEPMESSALNKEKLKKDQQNGKENPDDDLSEEDREKKEQLDLLVERAQDVEPGIQNMALEAIRSEIRSATSSMTSVPKPLKFLRTHYPLLKEYFKKLTEKEIDTTYPKSEQIETNKLLLADILSVLAMTMTDNDARESLYYKLLGTKDAPQTWGHEYVRHLCGEIAQEYAARTSFDESPVDDKSLDGDVEMKGGIDALLALADEIVPFLLESHAEPDACDLLMEVDSLSKLTKYIKESHSFDKVCTYLIGCTPYVPEPDDIEVLSVASSLYCKVKNWPAAMRVALRIDDIDLIKKIYEDSQNSPHLTENKVSQVSLEKLQIAFDLARQNVILDEESDDTIHEIMINARLSEYFLNLARDLGVMEPKVPEDIYKSHLVETRSTLSTNVDSARQNLASSFVNGFVNMGYGNDNLMDDEDSKWIFRNKEHGMMSATASLGLINLWDIDEGLVKIDKYLYASDNYVKAGALLAIGLLSGGCVRSDVDPALALLSEYLESTSSCIQHGAISGLGLSYAGTSREEILDSLVPIVVDATASSESVALAAISLGLVYVGTANGDLAATLIQTMADRSVPAENKPDSSETGSEGTKPSSPASTLSSLINEPLLLRLLPLSLGLLYLGTKDQADVISETVAAMVPGAFGNLCLSVLDACAYAGTGNVLKVQKFLSVCGEHPNTNLTSETAEETNGLSEEAQKIADVMAAAEHEIAVLSLAMIGMGEELGASMVIRACDHLLQYGDPSVRKTVPLAIGLLSISNPQILITDTLSKLSHDSDLEVAQLAIFAMGLIGAGTNNSRIAGLLRNLSSYYVKDPSSLFCIRIAQGLLHASKGLVTMNPLHSENFLMNKVAMGGLLTVLFSCLDMKGILFSKYHFLIYYLALCTRPKMVYPVDEKLELLPVSLRVGQAVDVVGAAGRPKAITGFQTHTAPVLLGAGERAELATDEYLSVTSLLEGVVILRKNPDFVKEEAK